MCLQNRLFSSERICVKFTDSSWIRSLVFHFCATSQIHSGFFFLKSRVSLKARAFLTEVRPLGFRLRLTHGWVCPPLSLSLQDTASKWGRGGWRTWRSLEPAPAALRDRTPGRFAHWEGTHQHAGCVSQRTAEAAVTWRPQGSYSINGSCSLTLAGSCRSRSSPLKNWSLSLHKAKFMKCLETCFKAVSFHSLLPSSTWGSETQKWGTGDRNGMGQPWRWC